jgi:hypothetical protein
VTEDVEIASRLGDSQQVLVFVEGPVGSGGMFSTSYVVFAFFFGFWTKKSMGTHAGTFFNIIARLVSAGRFFMRGAKRAARARTGSSRIK